MGTPFRRIDPDTRAVRVIDYRYPVTRMEYSDGKLIYRGIHLTQGAGADEDGWEIWKYTWSDDNLVLIEWMPEGVYDDKTELGWI
jgi:hypothetical protein